ncbi:MAG: hypothetical protein WBO55_02365 [Rhizobiaceae bacterium]
MLRLALIIPFLCVAFPAFAGEARIVGVKARQVGGSYTFSVTVSHADQGWDHYADKWQVRAPDGTVLGERVLLHPHDEEQPFTRSQEAIVVPQGIGKVLVRAHDTVHGWGATHEHEIE